MKKTPLAFTIASTFAFSAFAETPAEKLLLDIHGKMDGVLTTQSGAAVADEGVPLDLAKVKQIYPRLQDRDKLRLGIPMNTADLRQGKTGALTGQFYELIVHQSDPANASVTTWLDGAWKTLHVKLLKYSSSHAKDDRLCGDVIVIRAGKKFTIELENELVGTDEPVLRWIGGNKPSLADFWRQDAPQSDVPPQNRHSLFATNLHTHGLHVSPGGYSDNVGLLVEPRSSATAPANELPLAYDIRSDHFAGTFWYHPHLHGTVAYQVANGMAGALIVLPDPKGRCRNLDDIPEVAAANVSVQTVTGGKLALGRVFLLQQFSLSETKAKTPHGDSVWIVDPTEVNDRRELDDTQTQNPKLAGKPAADVTTVNGGKPADIHLRPGQVERWRFIHAGKEAAIPLKWKKVVNGHIADVMADEVSAVRIAEDGIPCFDVDGHGAFVNHVLGAHRLDLQPGYRSDLLVQPHQPGTYYLLQEAAPRVRRTPKGDFAPQFLARLVVEGTPAHMSLPKPDDIARCMPPDIQLENPDAVNQTIAFEFVDTEQFGVNGGPWAAALPPIVQTLGKAERWELKVNVPAKPVPGVPDPAVPNAGNLAASGEVEHPFHIHVNPFQVELGGGKFIWKDTYVVSEKGGPVHIRIQPADITGESVLHCHILDHEDQGMMRSIKIVAPDKSVHLFPSADRREVAGAQFEKGAVHLAVIYSGPSCEACNAALAQLDKSAAAIRKAGARITAISREQTGQSAALTGIRMLDSATAADSLAALDKDTSKPSHATYLIDKSGHVRFEYSGNHPIPDLGEVMRRVKELADE